jgi:hypothetical protein
MKNKYILIRCEGPYEGYTCEGFFDSVDEAKVCIKDWDYDTKKCELYELKSDKDFLKECK